MTKPENITVEITGMSCASCAQRIESAIGSAEGVSESIVNFATRKATVTGSVPVEEIARSEWNRFLTLTMLSVPVFSIYFNL